MLTDSYPLSRRHGRSLRNSTGYHNIYCIFGIPGGEDYGPFPTSELELSSIIPANVSETEFGMNIREDNIVEIPETFSVSLRLSEGMEPASIAEVVIEDNDCKICT